MTMGSTVVLVGLAVVAVEAAAIFGVRAVRRAAGRKTPPSDWG